MQQHTDIQKNAEYWATSHAFDQDTRTEIANLIKHKNSAELTDRFYKDLEFGTGGMRGIMGAGTARMNIYNIRKASVALGLYLQDFYPETQLKIAISYDSRINSKYFAKGAAEILAAMGIETLITSEMRPVPMLSFMVRHFQCHAGICVTASHNPPAYNGFKVYWTTGGQLTPPHDENIIAKYKSIESYDDLPFVAYDDACTKGTIVEVLDELDDAYFAKFSELFTNTQENQKNIKIVYSPLHGAGIYAVPKALSSIGFDKISLVDAQAQPDGSFPTVTSPNPEDPEALKLALDEANKLDADMVLATDPDCDRIALVVRDQQGELKALNGNQLGCLLIYYVLSMHKQAGTLPASPLVIKTIVTTELQRSIAESFGAHCEDTLTGFKWICDRIESYETGAVLPYREFVCGGEESYGFLAGKFVRDKDAVISCALAAEMVSHFQANGKNIFDVLDEIFSQHGVYQETLKTYSLMGQQGLEKMTEIMNAFRSNPPPSIANSAVVEVIDWLSGTIQRREDSHWATIGKTDLPQSNVLQFFLAGGSKISIRPSGTEPKIKVYVSICDKRAGLNGKNLVEAKAKVAQHLNLVEEHFTSLLGL